MTPAAPTPVEIRALPRALLIAWAVLALAFVVRLASILAAAGDDAAWGWLALPVLAVWFARERVRDWPAAESGPSPALAWLGAAFALALLAPARWLGEAFPGWAAVEWTAGLAWAGLAWLLVAAHGGWARARHLAFACFFPLAALPWPAFVAVELMGRLRLASAAGLAELFSLCGEPAVANGTVIELRAGLIGIEEACGGIRSLQAAVVLALAVGELRRDGALRRLGWVALGVALAVAANTARMAALTALCAQGGAAAVTRWHDAAGAVEFLAALGGLAALAWRSGLGAPARARPENLPTCAAPALASALTWAVAAGVVAVELAVPAWFALAGESGRAAVVWSADLAQRAPGFTPAEGLPAMRATLRCDALQVGAWRDAAGRHRAGYAVEWRRGQQAALVLPSHNPGVCLPAAGARAAREWPALEFEAGGLRLPFRVVEFSGASGRFFFYHLAWNLTAGAPLDYGADTMRLTWRERWHEARAGRRDVEVILLGVAIYDARSPEEAARAAREELGRLVRAGPRARE